MKKNFKWLMMFIMTLVMGVSLASCGDDDDENGGGSNPPGKYATEAYLQFGVYVSESTLKYFNVAVTDADGNNIADITLDNTTLVTDTVFGDNLGRYKNFFNYSGMTNATDNRLRLWTSDKSTIKNFPTTLTYTVTASKSGVVPAEDEKVYLVNIPDVVIGNDGTLKHYGVSGFYNVMGGLSGKIWDKIPTFKNTTTITFNAADDVTGTINK